MEKFYYQHHCQFRPSPGSDVLRRLYLDEGRSLEWITKHFGTSWPALKRWLDEAGIQRRPAGGKWKRRELDPQKVKELYEGRQMTILQVGKELGGSQELVERAMKAAGAIPRKSRKGRRPVKRNPTKDKKGYILVYCPGHPMRKSTGYYPQHRLVMEQHIGRILQRCEIVHHKNENTSDNRIENLELLSSPGEHTRLHNLQMSSANVLRSKPDSELQELSDSYSTVQIALHYKTSPASVQRLFHYRGICMRKPGGSAQSSLRKHPVSLPTPHQQQEPCVQPQPKLHYRSTTKPLAARRTPSQKEQKQS